jgi:flagellar basal body-associated protein FliL
MRFYNQDYIRETRMFAMTARSRIFYVYAFAVLMFLTLAIFGYCVADMNGLRRPVPLAGNFVTDMAYIDLPRINLQVGDANNEAHMRIEIALEVAKKDIPTVEGYQPQITDRLNLFLAHMRPEQLRQLRNIPELRADMLRLVNDMGSPAPIHDLMLRQMIIM